MKHGRQKQAAIHTVGKPFLSTFSYCQECLGSNYGFCVSV